MKTLRQFLWLIAFVPAGVAFSAQDYPARPIRFIVPFAPGGITDILARVVGERLTQTWGKQVVIDNRPGAGGNIAADITAKSAPDGYTLFLGSMGTQSMNQSLYGKLPFDPIRDFVPVSLVANSANLLLVRPAFPGKSVADLIRIARTEPRKLSFSSAGMGSFNHISAELFKMMAKIDMVHIPYKGGAPAQRAVVAGEADLIFITVAPAMSFVRSGQLKALAVCGKERHPLFPELPTASESGLPGFEVGSWYGILVPAKTPERIVGRLNTAIVGIVKDPVVNKRLVDLGIEPAHNTPREFSDLIRRDATKWAKVIKATGAKAN